jgi:threonyl-tRNA synthetase
MKIPLLGVIGAKEAETGAVSLRSRREGDLGNLSADDLLAAAVTANTKRAAGLGLPAIPTPGQ